PKNVIYAQAGGVTAVINTSAAAVFETVREHPEKFGKVYAAINGIVGVLEERLVDIDTLTPEDFDRLKSHPGAAFEACRFDLDPIEYNPEQYQRVLEVFKTYDIGYFFYNGGNGSMVTAQKVADYCTEHGHPVTCIGIAKTIDNDLALSHCSPGFGSAAKYVAASLLEVVMDLKSMHNTSTKFVSFEAMGRNTGWLTIAGGLLKTVMPDLPLLILPAERAFDKAAFLSKVTHLFNEQGYCICIVSEGLKDASDRYVAIANIEHTETHDYTQLGGVGYTLSHMVANELEVKTHTIVPDYLQRSASHFVSEVDWQMAYEAGKAAVLAALDNQHGVLPVVEATQEAPFSWRFKNVKLMEVADLEKRVPDAFISEDGMDITQAAIDYLLPLIQGERHLHYQNGLPDIRPFDFKLVTPKLIPFKAVEH
ncbi:MAG: 6-phosphofructokinase, partial [Hydrogenovibrio sp.]|nr:6-phosphofructokinase [Hydrogenovibrio sp.]